MKELFVKSVWMIYHATPHRFRLIFWPARLIAWLVRCLRYDLWIITGEEITTKQILTIIYTGSSINKNYFTNLAFDSSFKENHIGKTWVWNIDKATKGRGYYCSLMVTEVPKTFRILFKRKNCFYIPLWVSGEVDISIDISAVIRKDHSLKNDLRKIRKNGLNFEISNDLAQLQNFYYNMYLPYISQRHDNRAILDKFDFMKKEFGKCDLLLIKKEGEYVAGNLLIYENKLARLWANGVRDGNSDYVKDGALGASYYFSIRYLQEKGYKGLHFGRSRAFLKDGVLKYKKRWGLKITGASGMGFLVKPLLRTTGVKGFLLNNPFIYMDKKRLNSAVFVEIDEAFSKNESLKNLLQYYLTGVNKLFIYRFGEGDIRELEIVPYEFSNRVAVCSAESLFK